MHKGKTSPFKSAAAASQCHQQQKTSEYQWHPIGKIDKIWKKQETAKKLNS